MGSAFLGGILEAMEQVQVNVSGMFQVVVNASLTLRATYRAAWPCGLAPQSQDRRARDASDIDRAYLF